MGLRKPSVKVGYVDFDAENGERGIGKRNLERTNVEPVIRKTRNSVKVAPRVKTILSEKESKPSMIEGQMIIDTDTERQTTVMLRNSRSPAIRGF